MARPSRWKILFASHSLTLKCWYTVNVECRVDCGIFFLILFFFSLFLQSWHHMYVVHTPHYKTKFNVMLCMHHHHPMLLMNAHTYLFYVDYVYVEIFHPLSLLFPSLHWFQRKLTDFNLILRNYSSFYSE